MMLTAQRVCTTQGGPSGINYYEYHHEVAWAGGPVAMLSAPISLVDTKLEMQDGGFVLSYLDFIAPNDCPSSDQLDAARVMMAEIDGLEMPNGIFTFGQLAFRFFTQPQLLVFWHWKQEFRHLVRCAILP